MVDAALIVLSMELTLDGAGDELCHFFGGESYRDWRAGFFASVEIDFFANKEDRNSGKFLKMSWSLKFVDHPLRAASDVVFAVARLIHRVEETLGAAAFRAILSVDCFLRAFGGVRLDNGHAFFGDDKGAFFLVANLNLLWCDVDAPGAPRGCIECRHLRQSSRLRRFPPCPITPHDRNG